MTKINPYLSIQTDLDSPDLVETPHPQSSINMVFTSSGSLSDQYSRDAASSTVSIQGSGNHYHACASDDYDDVGFGPSILPPPDPWIDSVADDPMQVNFVRCSFMVVTSVLGLFVTSYLTTGCLVSPQVK